MATPSLKTSIADHATRQLATGLSANIRSNVLNALSRGAVGEFRAFAAFAKALPWGDPQDVATTNQDVMRLAQQAVLDGYERKVVSRGGRVAPYARPGRLSGKLGDALKDPGMFVGDSNGFSFIDGPALTHQAAHWKRLNFGAGRKGAGGEQNERVPLRLFGRSLFDIGFRIQVQPEFYLPVGFFLQDGRRMSPGYEMRGGKRVRGNFRETGSRYPFYATKNVPLVLTEGIEGRHFLEDGIEALAKGIGPAYDLLLRKWLQEGGKAAQEATAELSKVVNNPHLRGI